MGREMKLTAENCLQMNDSRCSSRVKTGKAPIEQMSSALAP